ncbi:MAG: hypothetical protein IKA37_07720 [Spirochaetales bacterium]|nr:hypothetical protein [Spirochaetales bacterium]
MYRKIMFFILAFVMCSVGVFAQETSQEEKQEEDKYTVNNYMIKKVFQCSEGLIVNYIDRDHSIKVLYVPNKFFREKKAFRITENNDTVAPQMNVILKNKKASAVKLYLSDNQSNSIYRYAEIVSPEVAEKFKIDEIDIGL